MDDLTVKNNIQKKRNENKFVDAVNRKIAYVKKEQDETTRAKGCGNAQDGASQYFLTEKLRCLATALSILNELKEEMVLIDEKQKTTDKRETE